MNEGMIKEALLKAHSQIEDHRKNEKKKRFGPYPKNFKILVKEALKRGMSTKDIHKLLRISKKTLNEWNSETLAPSFHASKKPISVLRSLKVVKDQIPLTARISFPSGAEIFLPIAIVMSAVTKHMLG